MNMSLAWTEDKQNMKYKPDGDKTKEPWKLLIFYCKNNMEPKNAPNK